MVQIRQNMNYCQTYRLFSQKTETREVTVYRYVFSNEALNLYIMNELPSYYGVNDGIQYTLIFARLMN